MVRPEAKIASEQLFPLGSLTKHLLPKGAGLPFLALPAANVASQKLISRRFLAHSGTAVSLALSLKVLDALKHLPRAVCLPSIFRMDPLSLSSKNRSE